MPLKHKEELSKVVGTHGAEEQLVLARRFTRPVSEEREFQRVPPSSSKFLLPVLAFIFVVLFTAGSVIFYHKQQLAARVVFDATQKRLLAQYRLYDQWRAPANKAYAHFLPDLNEMTNGRVRLAQDVPKLRALKDRLDVEFDAAAKIPGTIGVIGPGAAWMSVLASTRSSYEWVYRYKTAPYTLANSPGERELAETVYFSEANEYGYGSIKALAFRKHIHRMSNEELKKALLSQNIRTDPARSWNHVYDSCQGVLKSPPFVPDGLRLEYASKLK